MMRPSTFRNRDVVLGFFEPETRAAHREDAHPRVDQLGAQAAHLDVDHVRPQRLGLIAPRVLGDGLAIDHRGEAPHQQLEDVEFRGREIEQLAVHGDVPASRVQRQGSPVHHRRAGPAWSPLQRAHPGNELPEIEWLDQVVVGPRVQALDAVGRRVASGQHQDGGGPVVAPCPGRDLDAGDTRHAPVEDRDVVLVELQLLDGVIAAVDRVHQVTGILQVLDEHLRKSMIVLGDQDAHLQASCRVSNNWNSMVALFSTLTKPPMLGGVMPNSLKGNVIEPTSSISDPVSRASIGMVTDFVTPWMVRSPVAEMWIVWPLPASAASAIGDVNLNVAVGYRSLSSPWEWIRWSRLDWSLVSLLTSTETSAASTEYPLAAYVRVSVPVTAVVRPTASLGAESEASVSRTR